MERRVGLERTRLRATEKEEAIAGIKELYIFTILTVTDTSQVSSRRGAAIFAANVSAVTSNTLQCTIVWSHRTVRQDSKIEASWV